MNRATRPLNPFRRRLYRRIWWARCAIWFETYLNGLIPLGLGILGTCVIAGLDFSPLLGKKLSLGISLLPILIGTFYAYKIWRHLRFPSDLEGRKRIEAVNNLKGRPFWVIDDQPAIALPDQATRKLWEQHKRRAIAQLREVKAGWPKVCAAEVDPLGFRYGLPLALLALIASGGESALKHSLAWAEPSSWMTPIPPPELEIWIDPPRYTQQPSQIIPAVPTAKTEGLQINPPTKLTIPEQSKVTMRLRADEPAQLRDSQQSQSFTNQSEFLQVKEFEAIHDGLLEVVVGEETLWHWELDLVRDKVPVVEWLKIPQVTAQAGLKLSYSAEDDYGLRNLHMLIRRADGLGEPIQRDLALPHRRSKSVKDFVYLNMADHVWAGLPVVIELKAEDSTKTIGSAPLLPLTLPERQFQHPAAKLFYSLRRQLIQPGHDRVLVVAALTKLGDDPGVYEGDFGIHLGVRMATLALMRERPDTNLAIRLLWDMAIALEDGRIGQTRANLTALRERLEQALDKDSNNSELEDLAAELEQQLETFIEGFEEELAGALTLPAPEDVNMVDLSQLREKLAAIREMIRAGDVEGARAALKELQAALEDLDIPESNPQTAKDTQKLDALAQAIGRIVKDQEILLDRTFRTHQQMALETRHEEAAQLSIEQNRLAGALEDILVRLAELELEIPRQFSDATLGMRRSTETLDKKDLATSIDHQTLVLQNLKKGGQQSLSNMMQRMTRSFGQAGRRLSGRRDPTGKSLQAIDDGSVKIPGPAAIQRTREILDEIHRRIGEPGRQETEKDYLKRLIERY